MSNRHRYSFVKAFFPFLLTIKLRLRILLSVGTLVFPRYSRSVLVRSPRLTRWGRIEGRSSISTISTCASFSIAWQFFFNFAWASGAVDILPLRNIIIIIMATTVTHLYTTHTNLTLVATLFPHLLRTVPVLALCPILPVSGGKAMGSLPFLCACWWATFIYNYFSFINPPGNSQGKPLTITR